MYLPFFTSALLALQVSGAPILQSVLAPQQFSTESIISKLKSAEIIPDVLPTSFNPTVDLSLTYASHHASVSLGNLIPVPYTEARPAIQITPLSTPARLLATPTRTLAGNKTYTLVLSDPDATSRADPVKGQMCHWIVTGIKAEGRNASEALEVDGEGKLELRNLIVSGEEQEKVKDLVDYMQPAPPPKTGKHRYVFVLLEPDDDNDEDSAMEIGREGIKKPKERPHFGYGKVGKGVMDWAKDNGLRPVGANFFYAQNKKQ